MHNYAYIWSVEGKESKDLVAKLKFLCKIISSDC